METVWAELIKALPWGFVIITLRYLDIKEKADQSRERETNAKEKSALDRETQIVVSKAYADAINNLANVFLRLENTIIEQYKNIGVTKDIKDMALDNLQKDKKR